MAYQLATPGRTVTARSSMADAALRVVGVRGDHAEQRQRRGVVRRGREDIVADARGLVETLGLRRRLGAREGLFRRFCPAARRCRYGSAHAASITRPARPFTHCRAASSCGPVTTRGAQPSASHVRVEKSG